MTWRQNEWRLGRMWRERYWGFIVAYWPGRDDELTVMLCLGHAVQLRLRVVTRHLRRRPGDDVERSPSSYRLVAHVDGPGLPDLPDGATGWNVYVEG